MAMNKLKYTCRIKLNCLNVDKNNLSFIINLTILIRTVNNFFKGGRGSGVGGRGYKNVIRS